MQIYAGILVIASTLIPNVPIAIALFILHEMPRGCFSPLIEGYLQKRIPSSERATIASFCAIAPHIGGAIGLVVSGGIAQLFGISTAWIVGGASLIIGALLVARNGSHKSN